eukprot:CAMPEP_0194574488 /NCGR_PEP_ID=MMETSP0292-20121207/10318_1 /TAXON_ID=39354 /ORGANISM="Heterosigma akashiwo, Strain CCMP2393" /LENGTH=177 /DNA_ID=CAMNT_0039426017 /DNA_START=324 /DNA_END=855 /DNA_ORIENTATION=-
MYRTLTNLVTASIEYPAAPTNQQQQTAQPVVCKNFFVFYKKESARFRPPPISPLPLLQTGLRQKEAHRAAHQERHGGGGHLRPGLALGGAAGRLAPTGALAAAAARHAGAASAGSAAAAAYGATAASRLAPTGALAAAAARHARAASAGSTAATADLLAAASRLAPTGALAAAAARH